MVEAQPPRIRYRSFIADSARWDGFAFRPGDVVISTPPKCGTTWTQMLCALLIFDGPRFPAPLGDISPWLDMSVRPLAEVTAELAAQEHRRFIKTHTPLDGLPLHPDVTYLVVGRDPRDVMISYEHHAANLDFVRLLELRAAAVGNDDLAELPTPRLPTGDPIEWFRIFVTDETQITPPTLASVLRHLDTGWQRRREQNVALFHYADLTADLPGELLRLARVLGIPCSPERAGELAPEASLARMRDRAAEDAPSASQGTRGAGRTCAPSSAPAAAASGARVFRPPTSPPTRRGSRRSSARIWPLGRTAAGSRRASISTADTTRAPTRALGSTPARGDTPGRSASGEGCLNPLCAPRIVPD